MEKHIGILLASRLALHTPYFQLNFESPVFCFSSNIREHFETVQMENSVEKLWEKIEPLLLPYEGSASQLYVLDLPISELERTIDTFRQSAHHAVISALDGYTYPDGKRPLCNDISKVDVIRATSKNQHSVLAGTLWKDRSLNYWIWPAFERLTFDAELVFWADEFFNSAMDRSERIVSFRTVHALAEKFRENSPDSECVLSSHETGDPRDGRGQDYTVFW